MDVKKTTKRILSQCDKENKLVNLCLRKRLAWCNRTGLSYDLCTEQYSTYPRALADENGMPHKASKGIWKDKLQARYSQASPQVFSNVLVSEWSP